MSTLWKEHCLPVVSVAQMRQLDREIIAGVGIPGIVLMENAARATMEVILDHYPERISRAVIVCGTGNNGGDGMACARLLQAAGIASTVWLAGDTEKLKGDALANFQALEKCQVPVKYLDAGGTTFPVFKTAVLHAELIIDALFGTGLNGALEGLFAQAVAIINQAKAPVIAIDIPSGLNGDSCQVIGPAVSADITVTLGCPKPGLLLYPAAGKVGTLEIGNLGFPTSLAKEVAPSCFQTTAALQSALPRRSIDGQKNTTGRLLIIAGSPGMSGAAQHACRGALAAGTGYLRLAAPASLLPIFGTALPEVVVHGLPESSNGIAMASIDTLLKTAEKCDAVLIGPGLGRRPETTGVICEFARFWHGPLVADADAIFALAEDLRSIDKRSGELIITPHYGEMSRLIRTDIKQIEADPVRIATEFAQTSRAITVLKGPRIIIGTPAGEAIINTTGTRALATAGTGDLLAGVIAALYCRGMGAVTAAALGSYLCGLAGSLAGSCMDESLTNVSDVTKQLGNVMRQAYQAN